MTDAAQQEQGRQFKKSFGSRLKLARKSRHLTQKDLAAKLRIHYQLLNKYEGGFVLPQPEKMVAISTELGISLDYMLTGTERTDMPTEDLRLSERIRAVQSFPVEDREAIFRLIDAVTIRQSVEGTLRKIQPA